MNTNSQNAADSVLNFATKTHHMIEDFLTFWTDIRTHQAYLQRFLELTLKQDLKSYSRKECISFRVVTGKYPIKCKIYFK